MLKRSIDVTLSTAGLALLSPLLLAIACLIKISSPGTVFYTTIRVGIYGRTFKLIKFRSMVSNAEHMGPAVTGANDTRITSIGRILRRTKLDELPQLINVLRGEMSIVGPRPEDPKYVVFYTEEQRQVLAVRPGITSPASVKYRHEETLLIGDDWEQQYIEQILPAKLAIDLDYVCNVSVWRDLQIIFDTFRAVVK